MLKLMKKYFSMRTIMLIALIFFSILLSYYYLVRPNSDVNLGSIIADNNLTRLMDSLYLSDNPLLATEIKKIILEEAALGRFTGPSHSYKFTQNQAMQRGIYYLYLSEKYPALFNESEQKLMANWFVKITKRAFKLEWSDLYYAIAFNKPLTAPYRNQENGAGALIIYSEIIKNYDYGLAKKSIKYVKDNAVMWGKNFRNTDDSITYQRIWIYNSYNVARYLFPEWLSSENSKKSFDWLFYQWPSDCSQLGYNPDPETLIYDIMYLGAYLHNDSYYRWLADCSYNYSLKHNLDFIGFMPDMHSGIQYYNSNIHPEKPNVTSLYINASAGLTQFPVYGMPDKIVFRSSWEEDSLYALLNLRFDAWHAYKAPNAFITLHAGAPFIAEDIIKEQRSWLPKGRAILRDENIDRKRLNGFYIEENPLNKFFNLFDVFKFRWFQSIPKYSTVERFDDTADLDYSISTLANWQGWNNTRTSILFKNSLFMVIDENTGQKSKEHSIIWHTIGKIKVKDADSILLENEGHLLKAIFLTEDDTVLNIIDSKEDAEPYAKINPVSYDIYLTSKNKKSKIITIFVPVKIDSLADSSGNYTAFNAAKITSHLIGENCVGINLGDNSLIVLINSQYSQNDDSCFGLSTDSTLGIFEQSNQDTEYYYSDGTYLNYNNKRFSLNKNKNKINLGEG